MSITFWLSFPRLILGDTLGLTVVLCLFVLFNPCSLMQISTGINERFVLDAHTH